MICKGDRFDAVIRGEYYSVHVYAVRKDGWAKVLIVPANGDAPSKGLYRDGKFAFNPGGK